MRGHGERFGGLRNFDCRLGWSGRAAVGAMTSWGVWGGSHARDAEGTEDVEEEAGAEDGESWMGLASGGRIMGVLYTLSRSRGDGVRRSFLKVSEQLIRVLESDPADAKKNGEQHRPDN